jgi:hypothetical protein
LICFIGGGSNLLATRISNYQLTGYSSVIGASLGYYQRISSSTNLGAIFGHDLTSTKIYWTHIGWLVLMNENWYPQLVVWLLSGLGASIYAKYHLDNIVLFGGDIFKFF